MDRIAPDSGEIFKKLISEATGREQLSYRSRIDLINRIKEGE
jgi:hypothetical protein